jgi:hypothetical protein
MLPLQTPKWTLTELSLHLRSLDTLGWVHAVKLVQGLGDRVERQIRHRVEGEGTGNDRAAQLQKAATSRQQQWKGVHCELAGEPSSYVSSCCSLKPS